MSTARAARAPRRLDESDEALERVRRRPHLQVVDSPPLRRRARAPLAAGAVAIVTVFLALFGLVVFHTVLLQNQSEIDGLNEQLSTEREQLEEQRLEIAELEAPERVIAVAERQGLIAPDEVVMLEAVDPADASSGQTTPSSGQTRPSDQASPPPGDAGATP